LTSGETGASAKYLAWSLGAPINRQFHTEPADCWDFGRCVRMLDKIPELRANMTHFDDAPEHGPIWIRLIEQWSELEALYREREKHEWGGELNKRIRAIYGRKVLT
jgi:hypothetical protein